VFFVKFIDVVKIFNEEKRNKASITLKFTPDFKILFYVEDDWLEDMDLHVPKLNEIEMNLMPIAAYESILVNEKDELKLKKISFFTEGKCGEPIVVELNSMSKTTGKWSKKLENNKPLMNLHGCLVAFHNELGPAFYADEVKNLIKITDDKDDNFAEVKRVIDRGNLTYRGFFHEITKEIAKKANLTAYHQIAQFNGTMENLISQNGKTLNTMLVMQSFTFTRSAVLQDRETLGYHLTSPYASIDFYYLVTPNDFYTNYEKVFFAFETYAWMSFGLTFGFTFGAILVVNRVRRRIQNVIFGIGIRNPTLNALSIFFGISQTKLPRENFARILLAMFVFLCLIFRTCYQSKMFEFMTTDMRKPMPETIEDLISMDYTVVIEKNEIMLSNPYIEFHEYILNGRQR
jgi:hypothetical protein